MLVGYGAIAILLLLALAGVTLEKAYFYLPISELRRRADKGDAVAKALAAVAASGDELRLFLVSIAWSAAGIALVLLIRLTPIAVGLVGTLIALLVLFFWQIRAPLTAYDAKFAALCSRPIGLVVARLHSVLRPSAKLFVRYHLYRNHTGLYEQADVVELLARQRHQRDNRISPDDLSRLQRVLEAGTCTVEALMLPRGDTVAVKGEDQISPVLINELHQSGQVIFPVYERSRSNIVGLLKLNDIADVKQHGRVVDAMDRRMMYLRDTDPLERAVRAFYETHQELFIVIDEHEKYIGVLGVGAILAYVFGKLDNLAYGHFDDPAAVAHKQQR